MLEASDITDKPLSGHCCCVALVIFGENLYDVSKWNKYSYYVIMKLPIKIKSEKKE